MSVDSSDLSMVSLFFDDVIVVVTRLEGGGVDVETIPRDKNNLVDLAAGGEFDQVNENHENEIQMDEWGEVLESIQDYEIFDEDENWFDQFDETME